MVDIIFSKKRKYFIYFERFIITIFHCEGGKIMKSLSELDWLHQPLSSLIASDCGNEVTIQAEQLAAMAGVNISTIIEHGEEIAERCSQKFNVSPQSWYNWHVKYVPNCFVAIKK